MAATRKKTASSSPKPKKKKTAEKTEKAYPTRDDFGRTADEYLATQTGEKRAILDKLRALIRRSVPGVEESIKWGMPVYSKNGLLCYMRAFSNHVSFGFYGHRDVMQDPDRLLEGGSDDGGHVKLRSLADIQSIRFAEWLRLAAAANAR